MMKTIVITMFVAASVALIAGRDGGEVAAIAVHAGIAVIRLGLALEPRGHEAGSSDDNDESDIKDEHAVGPVAFLRARPR